LFGRSLISKKGQVMKVSLAKVSVAAVLLSVSMFSLYAADAAVSENPFAKAIGLAGARPKGVPKALVLKQGESIVAIGDSITQAGGYLTDSDAVLAKEYPALKIPKIVNVGISGQKAEDLVGRFQNDVVARKPAVVTLSIGINDVWHRVGAPHDAAVLKAYKDNVAKMVTMAQEAKIKVILLTPTLITENPADEGNKRLVMYVDAMKEIAAEKKCVVIDLHDMFLTALKKKPADVQGNWLTSDGVHMAPMGDTIMALGVLRGLGVPDAKIGAK